MLIYEYQVIFTSDTAVILNLKCSKSLTNISTNLNFAIVGLIIKSGVKGYDEIRFR